MPDRDRNLPHVYWSEEVKPENYTSLGTPVNTPPNPERDRAKHAQVLELAIGTALREAREQIARRNPNLAQGEPGFLLEFKVKDDSTKAFENLQNAQKKIELLAVTKSSGQGDFVNATVFVPESASEFYLKKIRKYRDKDTKNGKPKNASLVTRLETVQIGKVESLFTDRSASFPEAGQEVWWEVWLLKERRHNFHFVAEKLNVPTKSTNILSFPEREIVLAMTTVETLAIIIQNTNAIAELRIAKDNPSVFLNDMGAIEQEEWCQDLLNRTLPPGEDAVAITLLDTGVNHLHSLLQPGLSSDDLHTCDPSWGTHDSQGHGTQMAGIALYADLVEALSHQNKVELKHRLESVKFLPPYGNTDPELYGAITEQAVFFPEISASRRQRVFCMPVTSDIPSPNDGTPSSWSAAIDQLCFGDESGKRLFIISAGNIRDRDIYASDYLNINDLSTIENPGQSWNSLNIGAYTEKINIIDPNYSGWQSVAPCGDLSPRSRTSVAWDNQWPIRPDVVFEGGNLAFDGHNPAEPIDDLCLLTTDRRLNLKQFAAMRDTSCATVLGSFMAARIMTEKPNYWQETVRALIVHSAEWTPAMMKHFNGASTKTDRHALLRRYGYGVPSFERALLSAKNDLTIITEDELQPYHLENNRVKTKDMKLHVLPWPKEKLESLGATYVELKLTLAYFIEPNPGERGYGARHRYASHGLRFKVKRASETVNDFKWRINKAVRDEQESQSYEDRSEEGNWFLGQKIRNRGSLHSVDGKVFERGDRQPLIDFYFA
ncbi:MAG: S8 family peptidase [Xenococcaceae cyanobacterium MO_188.B32]|nr:S8 family peptidase [Xenococcaceae cyanobacterium MO_188.B32]